MNFYTMPELAVYQDVLPSLVLNALFTLNDLINQLGNSLSSIPSLCPFPFYRKYFLSANLFVASDQAGCCLQKLTSLSAT